jgi:mono/diheme cytochrome c family protein
MCTPTTSSRRARLRRPALLAALAGVAVTLAGCGGGSVGHSDGSGDRVAGKELFVANCGSCHTLADAGTTGQIGPNLDAAFYQSRIDGLGESTIVQVVRGQIAYPVTAPGTGAPGMPADIVTGTDAEDVTAYVASVAGLAKPESGSTTPPPTDGGDGGGGGGGTPDGAAIFASAGCGNCHTLAAADATGNVGPNLDEAKPAEALVLDRVTNGQGGMPSFSGQLSKEEIAAVAAYVADNAGR